MYQRTPAQAVAKNGFCLYHGDAKYCHICLGFEHKINEIPFMPREVQNVVGQQRGNSIAKRTVEKPHVPCGRERRPYYGQGPVNHYLTASCKDCRVFNKE